MASRLPKKLVMLEPKAPEFKTRVVAGYRCLRK
jgi:hypothetical protein